jgi:hypothetical protein
MAMLYVMVANICSLNVHGPGLSEWRTPNSVTPQSGSSRSSTLAQGYSRIWITDPLRPADGRMNVRGCHYVLDFTGFILPLK